MIKSKAIEPRIFPWNNDVDPVQIDRVQELGGDETLGKEKQYEIGRDGILGFRETTPTMAYTLRQFEYGSVAFFRKLANMEDPVSGGDDSVDLSDLETARFDIATYMTDDNGTYRGTAWFPRLRVGGFSVSIGDPEALIERSFDLVGEEYKIIDGKYLSFEKASVGAPGNGLVVCSPDPILFEAGKYIFRVLRVRSGVVSELIEGGVANDTWSYSNATKTVTVKTCLAGDLLKVYYPSATTDATIWADNDVDPDFVKADQVTIYLKVGAGSDQQIYRLQSATIDVSFDRTDYREIGNKDVVQTGVRSKTVTVTLGRILEDFTLEEVLRGTSIYPYIDARKLADNITLTVKIYTDNTKTAFLSGYKVTDLSPTSLTTRDTVEEYATHDNALEADNFKITTDESEL